MSHESLTDSSDSSGAGSRADFATMCRGTVDLFDLISSTAGDSFSAAAATSFDRSSRAPQPFPIASPGVTLSGPGASCG
jgi:hypothetical protein